MYSNTFVARQNRTDKLLFCVQVQYYADRDFGEIEVHWQQNCELTHIYSKKNI
jgi:hypothetical protein